MTRKGPGSGNSAAGQQALRDHRADPTTAALKHQVHRFLKRGLYPVCDKCVLRDDCEDFTEGGTCGPAEQQEKEITAEIIALERVQPEDRHHAKEFARMTVAMTIIDAWLGRVGLFRHGQGGLDAQAVWKTRMTCANHQLKLSDRLGLSPAARAKLDAGRVPAQNPLVRAVLEQEADRQRQAVIEGEFTQEGEPE